MIRIVTLDKHGQPAIVEEVETITIDDDVIIMNPGVPPIHTAAFDDYLRAAIQRYNPPIILSLARPDTTHKPVQFWRPDLFARGGSV